MTFRRVHFTRPASRSTASLFTLLGLLIPGTSCGIEGEDIDYADTGLSTSGETGSGGGTEDSATNGGDGDGDPSSTGDGDGDGAAGDGDGSPGDGDGDGDGTGDMMPCDQLMATPVGDGPNPVMVADGTSMFEAACGAAGPESLYVYTASATGLVNFTLSAAEFDAAMYLVQGNCVPLEELACAAAPDPVSLDLMMNQGELVYVFVDSINGVGGASLDITVN